MPEGVPTSFGIGAAGEMLPSYDNCVTLNARKTDAWGVPIAHIRCALSENDEVVVREGTKALREMTEHCGYQANFIGSVLGLDSEKVFPDAGPVTRFVFRRGIGRSLAMGAAIHECGGARMASPARVHPQRGETRSGTSRTCSSLTGPRSCPTAPSAPR